MEAPNPFNNNTLPTGLASLAGNRDLITTQEFAQVFNVASQTIRKNYCQTGKAYGIKPLKIGNRLLWSVAHVAKRLQGAI